MGADANAGRKRSWKVPRGSEVVPGRTVLERLGGGRRTEVYRCTDDALGAPVVVKILRPGRTGEKDVAVLRREAATLVNLAHAGFPRLVAVELDTEPAWLAMTHVDGPHLSELVRDHGPLEVEQGTPLLRDVADALAHLHQQGRVHLDVKPANIVMGTRPVLLDLGASRTVERAARLRAGVGTITYLSPEQADPGTFGPPGPASDLFGLGVTVVRAMTGNNPYGVRRDQPDAVDEAALATEVRGHAAGLPGALGEVVAACLELDPSARPTATEVVLRLDAATMIPRGGGVLRRLSDALRGPRPGALAE